MAHLLASLKDYFELEETNIDNWAFKLFYKVSCGLCMVGATIGVASQYFGEPIRYHQRAAMDHLTLGAPILGDKIHCSMFQLRVQWDRWRICKRLLLGAWQQLHPDAIPGDH